jgi:hypothetical protein
MKLQQGKADSSSDEIRKFLSGGRTPIFKFKAVGDRIRGALAEPPKLLPLTQFGSNEPKLDDDGNPVMQLLLVLKIGETRTALSGAPEQVSKQRVYIDKPLLREKLGRAIEDSGADDLEVDGVVEIVRIRPGVLGLGWRRSEWGAMWCRCGPLTPNSSPGRSSGVSGRKRTVSTTRTAWIWVRGRGLLTLTRSDNERA